MKKINPTTYHTQASEHLEVVVGDEKQAKFYPRVKLKKWDNEVNFSIGTTDTSGRHSRKGSVISYKTLNKIIRFYPNSIPKRPAFDTSFIRLIKMGAIPPHQIGSIYEVSTQIAEAAQTINVHWSDRYAMMYYGYYDAESYLDLSKVNIPQMRVAPVGGKNEPMVMDESLKLIDIHYDPDRDDIAKIDTSIRTAVRNVLKNYPIKLVDGDTAKMYFWDGDKQVKFYSGAFIGGHYYFYINLGLQYNDAHKYYRDDVKPSTKNIYAYGLRAVAAVPDSIVDEVITEYARLYGLPINEIPYSADEQTLIDELNTIHQQEDWVLHGQRDDFYAATAPSDGFEFEIILKNKPKSNVIPLTVRTKELAFHYQAELTAEERLTSHRPVNVVKSYAAYHMSKSNNAYGTGKAFHIYRPWAVDATGRRIWCDFDPDWDGRGDLNITISQDFLDSAVYPVIIDPTFGYSEQGPSTYTTPTTGGVDDEHNALLSITGAAGNVTHLNGYIAVTWASSTLQFVMGLYAVGSPTSPRVDYSAEQSFSASSAMALRTLTAQVLVAVSASSYDIQISFRENVNYNSISIAYETITNAGGRNTAVAYSSPPPDPEPTMTTNSRKYSLYVTYVPLLTINLQDGTSQVSGPMIV